MLVLRCAPGGLAERGIIHGGSRILPCLPEQVMIPCAGLKNLAIPDKFNWVEFPEKNKLRYIEKVPVYPHGIKAPKMMKNLRWMRGPEEVHNKLIHKQYGIVALQPGRLKFGHFEMMRMTIGRKMDPEHMFAIWRIDPPWQSVTKKSPGMRMGGGKGSIDHYVTPIKTGRIILELGGRIEYREAYPLLKQVAHILPFKAKAISQEILEQDAEEKKRLEAANTNPYTFKYIVQNNLGGSHNWISPYDRRWFGEHL